MGLLLCTAILFGCTTHSDSTAISSNQNLSFAELTQKIEKATKEREAEDAKRYPSKTLVPVLFGTPLSLDLNATFLPPEYKGDNLNELINKFEKISEKDKYETTSNYVSRLQNAVDSNIIYAFEKDYYIETISYNADVKELSIDIFNDSTIDGKNYFHISTEIKDSSNYIGTNVYGAMVDVKRISTKETALAVDDLTNKVIIKISIEPEAARKLEDKENIGFLFISKIHKPSGFREPIAFQKYEISKATIDNPKSYFSDIHFLSVDLYQVWVFDKISGKVLAKHNIN